MNENVIKALDAIDAAISNEQAKIEKMKSIRNDFLQQYKKICSYCKKEALLFQYSRTMRYSIDCDSDWIPWGDEYDTLKCPSCEKENKINSEVKRIIRYGTARFKNVESIVGGRGR